MASGELVAGSDTGWRSLGRITKIGEVCVIASSVGSALNCRRSTSTSKALAACATASGEPVSPRKSDRRTACKRQAHLRRAFRIHVDEHRPDRGACAAETVDCSPHAVERRRTGPEAGRVAEIDHQHASGATLDRVGPPGRVDEMEVRDVGTRVGRSPAAAT